MRERERETRERKKGPLVVQAPTQLGCNEPIIDQKKACECPGCLGFPSSPLPQELGQNKEGLLKEGFEVDGLVPLLLVYSKWFRFAASRLTEHPCCQCLSTVMGSSVWLYLSPREVLRLKPFKLRVEVVSMAFLNCCHVFSEAARVTGRRIWP